MKRTVHTLSRTLFALGILGSLTFGATQAFGFSLPQKDASRPWCDPVKCNAQCGGYGICQNNVCLCY
jgi:hypothetical protein